jgi:hypothetical protein
LTFAHDPQPGNRLATVTRDSTKETAEGESGFFKLFRNDDAMWWRLLLADLAEETLDMQYFIWKPDASGDLLLDRVIKAADRGVRVGFLIDDTYLIGADRTIAGLSQHLIFFGTMIGLIPARPCYKIIRIRTFCRWCAKNSRISYQKMRNCWSPSSSSNQNGTTCS